MLSSDGIFGAVPVQGFSGFGRLTIGNVPFAVGRGATFCLPLNTGKPTLYGSITIPAGFTEPQDPPAPGMYLGLGAIGQTCVSTYPNGSPSSEVAEPNQCSTVAHGTLQGDFKVSGHECVQGSLEVTGNVSFASGDSVLYVNGNLTVDGDVLPASGDFRVTGGMTVKGSLDAFAAANGFIVAGGDLQILSP